MFSAILDDPSILNDPENEGILDDLLKYCDEYAEDQVLRKKSKGPTIYNTQPKTLHVGRIMPDNTEVNEFAPLENDGKPLTTLLEMVTYDDKKGDFARKVLLDSVPEPQVAQTLLQNHALEIISDAKKTLKAKTIDEIPEKRRDQI